MTSSEQTWSLNQVIAHNVRRLRRDAKYTQPELAALMEAAGLHWNEHTVSHAELAFRDPDRGRRFTVEELVALAVPLGTTPLLLMLPPDGVRIRVGNTGLAREGFFASVFGGKEWRRPEPRREITKAV